MKWVSPARMGVTHNEIFLQSHRLYAGDNMYRVVVSVCDTENFIK